MNGVLVNVVFLIGIGQEPRFDPDPLASRPAPARHVAPPVMSRSAPTAPIAQNFFLRTYDRNGDGRLATYELPLKFDRRFDRADANGDGFLDPAEILGDRGRIGQLARRMEEMKLDRDGKLHPKGRGGSPVDVLILAVEAMNRLDTNNDGYVDLVEIQVGLRQPPFGPGSTVDRQPSLLAPVTSAGPAPADNAPGRPSSPATNGNTVPGASENSRVTQATPQPADRPMQPPRITADGYPTVDAILDHLDKNQNGVIDRTEAVDKLADNFKRVDKNNDGRLDPGEIDRALRLARMLGIKPSMDPRMYSNDAGAGAPSSGRLPAPKGGRL